MRLINSLLIGLMIAISLAGCALKEKKNAENASVTPAKPALKKLEPVMPPVLMTNPQDRAGFIITHYWDKFDFRDTMYCHAPDITEDAFSNFINFFPYATYNKVSEAIKKLLDSAEVDAVMYNYFIRTAEHYLFDPNSPARNDEYYIPFLEHIVASKNVVDESKIRPQFLLQIAYRNRPGAKAEDIVYTTAAGRTGRLYNITARYVLVMFFNPDCKECKETTNRLKSSPVIASAVSSGRLKVLAVYPDEQLDIWRSHLDEIPATWINGYDKALTLRNNHIYDLKAIPTLYLLDENKNVILKDTSTGHIHDFLEKNP